MSEELKNIQEELDKKIEELTTDSMFKTEEEKAFVNSIADSLKNGQLPIDLVLGKSNEAISKLNDLKKEHPEFESFVNYHQTNISEAMQQLNEAMKNDPTKQ